MVDKSALTKLLEAVEAGEWSSRRIDAEVDAVCRVGTKTMRAKAPWAYNNFPNWRAREDGRCEVVHTNGQPGLIWDPERFSTSLDAALALKEAVLPGLRLQAIYEENSGLWSVTLATEGEFAMHVTRATSNTPARALLLCVIKALIEEGKA